MTNLIKMCQELTSQGDTFIDSYGPLEFHKKAHELLENARLHELFDLNEFVHATFDPAFNKNQNYASAQFSDLPITIANGTSCFLDIYFWRRRPTVIHDHHFTGAFQCLYGQNIDSEFDYIKTRKLGVYHDVGIMNLKRTRKLNKGDIAAIDHLDKFVHQTHHEGDLTINLCFRTPDIGVTNLSNYLYSGLRFEKHPELLNRVSRLMSFIHMSDFKIEQLNLTIDDALIFLIQNYRSESLSQRFLSVKNFMENKVKTELDLDLSKLLDEHEKKMDQLENQIN